MPARLALFLCLGFVWFLFRLDRKVSPPVSRALWLPTLWMLCIASRPLGAWMMLGEDASSSPMDQLFLLGLLGLGVMVLQKRRVNWMARLRDHRWLMWLVAYMLVSICWSDIPFTSFKRWTRELVAVTMALVVATEPSGINGLETVIRRSVYVLIPFSMVLIKYFPEYGLEYNAFTGQQMWVGVATQKNGLGRLCLISAFFLIWILARTWKDRKLPNVKNHFRVHLLLLLIALFLLKGPPGCFSSTSVTVLVLGSVTFFGLSWFKKSNIAVPAGLFPALTALLICYGSSLPLFGGFSMGSLTSALGRNGTLTGRTDIWAKLLPSVKSAPVLGAGFGGFWTPETRARNANISQAHNGYLNIVLELGFVGLLLFSGFLVSSCRKAYQALSWDFDHAALCIGYLLMACLHNATEASMDSFTNQLTAILLFFTICLPASPAAQPVYEQNCDTEAGPMPRSATNPGI